MGLNGNDGHLRAYAAADAAKDLEADPLSHRAGRMEEREKSRADGGENCANCGIRDRIAGFRNYIHAKGRLVENHEKTNASLIRRVKPACADAEEIPTHNATDYGKQNLRNNLGEHLEAADQGSPALHGLEEDGQKVTREKDRSRQTHLRNGAGPHGPSTRHGERNQRIVAPVPVPREPHGKGRDCTAEQSDDGRRTPAVLTVMQRQQQLERRGCEKNEADEVELAV